MSKNVTLLLCAVLFICAAIISFSYFQSPGTGSTANSTSPNNQLITGADDDQSTSPRTEQCPLNGALFTQVQRKKWESRRPLGVAIENHLDARPQSGLSRADVVYEAVAEGGITRFLALFYCRDATPIGPVRSARIYFLRLLQGYGDHPLYAHVGGANTPGPADALGEIQDLGWDGYNDLNQFAVPFPYYYRDYERLPNRATEHTMYSSTQKLWEYAAKERKLTSVDDKNKKWDTDFTPWKFADEAKQSKRGPAGKVSFGFWTKFDADNYAVSWAYEPATNLYTRSNGGKPHIDKDTGKPLTTKNIVVVFADESPARDGYEGGHLLYDIIGSGNGLLFQNGTSQQISWNKKDEESMMRFEDENGKEVSFARGQIFVEILPTGNKVTY